MVGKLLLQLNLILRVFTSAAETMAYLNIVVRPFDRNACMGGLYIVIYCSRIAEVTTLSMRLVTALLHIYSAIIQNY